ncbi:MAG: prephenate dehydrogenase [Candidatus Theseobacter exili]|nr:prephenate dehydrogenase [Candidatus Theseobacter exili]
MQKISIIGVGLIGGSFGLAIRKRKLAKQVIGIVRRESAIDECLQAGVADKVSLNIEDVADSDLIVLGIPAGSMVNIATRLAEVLKKKTIVIDAASVKGELVYLLETIFENKASFVGAHPMSGSEKNGVAAAKEDLFEDSICVLTKTEKTDNNAFETVKEIWTKLGSFVLEMDPYSHDKAVASVSHLPHLVSSALVNSLPESIEREEFLKCSGKGWSDMTRIASGLPDMWAEICLENRENVLDALNRFRDAIDIVDEAINEGNYDKLKNLLQKARSRKVNK